MNELEQAIELLRVRDEKKRAELEAILDGMPVVQRYVAQNHETWQSRRGSKDLDGPDRKVRATGTG